MLYLTFEGKSKEEAQSKLELEKKRNPQLKEGRLIKCSEEPVSSFMGFKKETVHKIVIGVPEHSRVSSFSKKEQPTLRPKVTPEPFSPIERAVITKKSRTILENEVADTLFSIDRVSKVAQQISQLENNLPKKTSLPKPISLMDPPKSNNAELKKEISSIRTEFKQVKEIILAQQKNIAHTQLMDSLQENRGLPNEHEICQQHIRWIEKYLGEREFSLSLIEDIINHLKQNFEVLSDKKTILKKVAGFLRENLPISNIHLDNYIYGTDIMFIGSTGVGKTCTIVKLATHLSLIRKKKCRFISIDRYKVGGETQLERLASYMQTKLHSISKQEYFFTLISEPDTDYTFIDTPGKAPKEHVAIQELSHWISMTGRPIDVHLVVSATTKVSDLDYICDAYKVIDYKHILVTKLDETKTFGSIVSLVYKFQKPLSFVTDGQEIPQDFEIADLHKIIKDSLA